MLFVALAFALLGTFSAAGFASALSHPAAPESAGLSEAAAGGQPAVNRTPSRWLGGKLALRPEKAGDGDETTPELPGLPPPLAEGSSTCPILLLAHPAVPAPRPLQGRAQSPRAPPYAAIV